MKPTQRHLSLTALLAIVLCFGLLAACTSSGSAPKAPSAAPDPLVGTWRHQWLVGNPPPDPPLIITKTKSGYLATFVYSGAPGAKTPSPRPTISIPLAWRSSILTGTFKVGTAIKGRAQVVYQGDTGHLLWSQSGKPAGPFDPWEVWIKVSAGTAYPSP